MGLTIAILIVLATYWRFKDLPMDRDYAPYAYHTLHGGWLRDGHADIKTPLIHLTYSWGQWVHRALAMYLPMPAWGTPSTFRAVPFMGILLGVVAIGVNYPIAAIVLALLITTPSMWSVMANTEWLSVAVLAGAIGFASSPEYGLAAMFLLGALPWANQKNAILLPFLSLVPEFRDAWTWEPWAASLAFAMPSILILSWIAATGRLKDFYTMCWVVPKDFGGRRTFKGNTLVHSFLLKPPLTLMLPFLIFVDWANPWAWVLVAMIGISVWTKQIMPVHFIPWCLALAMASQPAMGSFVAFLILWIMRELVVWLKPATFYPICFPSRSGIHYGVLLQESEIVTDWLKEFTKPEETIWCNTWDNNIYLQAERKAWCFLLPEMVFEPEAGNEPPRVIVHGIGHLDFDYDRWGYVQAMITPRGCYTVMIRRGIEVFK
jgi:hypothetical protein